MAKSGLVHESTHNETVEWYTPKWVFDKLGVEFDVDVCSPGSKITPWIPAKDFYTPKNDGLKMPWYGFVWMNPPYGKETPKWIDKFLTYGDGIALVFARTDTQWFHEATEYADAFVFTKGRIKFIDANGKEGGTPGAGSLFIGCGLKAITTLRHAAGFNDLGWYVRL